MTIKNTEQLLCMQKASDAAAITLKEMRHYAAPGMTTKELDEFGAAVLDKFGARSAPKSAYDFPGHTCISLNHEIAHGIPSSERVMREGDLINIDVSVELNGFWADNGGSFVLGQGSPKMHRLVKDSSSILHQTLSNIKAGVSVAYIGKCIQNLAKKHGYKVIENLCGHGIGYSLHEEPTVPNVYVKELRQLFKKGMVVAIETFISTKSTVAESSKDGWTLIGNRGGYTAQHEHTIVVTDGYPLILTDMNDIRYAS